MKLELELSKDELNILRYVLSMVDSPYAADPLKDTYEMGDDEPEDPYAVLHSAAEKFYEAAKKAEDAA